MKHFPTWWIIAVLIVTIHQIIQKICQVHIPIVDHYLDAALFLPITLELILWEKKWMSKNENYSLSWMEIIAIVLILSFITEYLFPKFQHRFVQDNTDIVLYIITAIIWKLKHNGAFVSRNHLDY